jgi:DNA-binding CsgD family transcriptional regulator
VNDRSKPDAPDRGELVRSLGELGARAPSLREAREGMLEILRPAIPFDAAIVHALSPRVPLETAVIVGIDPAQLAATMPTWDTLAVELGRLRSLANERLAASDLEAFVPGTPSRTRFVDLIERPLGIRSIAVTHLVVRGAVRAAILLASRRDRAFDATAIALLRTLAPTLAIVDALHETLDDAPRRSSPTVLRCEDTRLTKRQREIVEHVAHGHTNAAIADALGLSPNTLRNHLATIFGKLGAANRADVVRLAVLTPSGGGSG